MASSNSQIDKPQRGRPKRAELPDVNTNTGAQSNNTLIIAPIKSFLLIVVRKLSIRSHVTLLLSPMKFL